MDALSNHRLLERTLKDQHKLLIMQIVIRRRMRVRMIYREINGKNFSEWRRRRVRNKTRSLMRSSGRRTLKHSPSSLTLTRNTAERLVDHLLLRRRQRDYRRIESTRRTLSLLILKERDLSLLLLEVVVRLKL